MSFDDRPGPLRNGDFMPKPQPSRAAAAAGGRGSGRSGSNGGDHQPPRLAASAPPPRNPGLTPIFNAAAKPPVPPPTKTMEQQLAELRALLSKPQPVRNLTPRGTDSNKPNPERDRAIQKHIDAILAAAAEQRSRIRSDLNKAAIRGTAKQAFNKASRGR